MTSLHEAAGELSAHYQHENPWALDDSLEREGILFLLD
jgi:hypothetical protein